MNISNYPYAYVIKLDKDGFLDGGTNLVGSDTTEKDIPYFTRVLYPNPKFYKPKIDGATIEEGEFVGGQWIDGEDPVILSQHAEYKRVNIRSQMKIRFYNIATRNINILQDAIDLDISTDEEAITLKKWKLYRHKVGVLDASSFEDFPQIPETIDGTSDTYESVYNELSSE